MTFPQALKSFVGYLEGTQKAAHTIKNYRLDLLAFQEFLERGLNPQAKPGEISLQKLGFKDLERFHDYLKAQGLKTNTRRRKLLTIRRFLVYLSRRKKLPPELERKLPTPHKVERVPLTVPSDALIAAIRALPGETLLDQRNRAMLWTLAETGCLVSELTRLRYEDFKQSEPAGARIEIGGKSPRTVGISRDLYEAIQALKALAKDCPWLFLGFNKFGPLGSPITPRGVEILVKLHSEPLGFAGLTPRSFRHSAVLQWFKTGVSEDEIQRRLGLKTKYAFRTFAPLLKGPDSAYPERD